MKKSIKKVLTLSVSLLTCTLWAADTDIHVAAELGYNYSPQMPTHGLQVGAVVDIPFPYVTPDPHMLGCELGLDYGLGDHNYLQQNSNHKEAYQQFKSSVVDHGGYVTIYSEHLYWHSLNIPIRIYYAYTINPQWEFRLYSGPALRFNVAVEDNLKHEYRVSDNTAFEQKYSNLISGKTYTIERYNDIEYKTENSIDKSERIPWYDLAWGLGIGISYKRATLNVRYDLDLLFKQKPRDILAVTIAYRIR